MLLRWDIENPGQLKPFLTPENQWNGCTYTESFDLPTARTQEGGSDKAPELVGDWKVREDFLKDNNAAGLLCAAGAVEQCTSGTVSASSNGESSSPSSSSDSSTSSSTASSDEDAATMGGEEKPAKKKRGRKRGGRRGGRGGKGGGQEVSLQQ